VFVFPSLRIFQRISPSERRKSAVAAFFFFFSSSLIENEEEREENERRFDGLGAERRFEGS